MDLKRYRELLEDDTVLKCTNELDFQCKSADESLSIGVYFDCNGLEKKKGIQKKARVLLTVYPGSHGELTECHEIRSTALFLVNSDSPSRSYTYKLTIHPAQEMAIIQVNDMPEEGRELISDLEITGITKTILPSHRSKIESS